MSDEIAELLTARKLGATAFYLGKELTDNPFNKEKYPELSAAWEKGFKDEPDNWEPFK